MQKYTLKKLPLDINFNSVEILELSIKAYNNLSELDKAILSLPNFELILQPLTVREAVASNEIENIRTTTIEMLQVELLKPQTLPSAQKEVAHYKKSLLMGLNIVQVKGKIEIEDIINIHSGIVPDKVGIRNRGGVYVGNRLGQVIYTPPQNEKEILEFVDNLFEYMYSDQPNSLVKIILTHYQFEAIHPFFDGNGRTGRILMALQFCIENKLRYPILFTSGYIVKNKSTYYELFKEIQDKDNWIDWIKFHLNGIINQSYEALLRVNEIKALQSEFLTSYKNSIKIQSKSIAKFESYFFSKAFYTQTDMATTLTMSRNSTKKYLEQLEQSGILQSRKAGRETLYFIQEFLDILS
jgi:Fic family protein